MATYQISGPNGEQYQVDGPDGADPSAVIAHVTGQKQAKSFDLVNGQQVPTGSPQAKLAQSPTTDGNNFLAGIGKGMTDLARGAGQMVGAVSRKDIADSRALDTPLMQTGAGKAGMLTGTVAGMLPAAFIPGANTMAGAAGIGAATGLMQPSTSTGETLRNTAMGTAAGPIGLGVGRGLGALYQGAKAALEPFFLGGQDRIAARTLQSFAGGPQQAQAAASSIGNAPAVLPGVQPTTAELANNAGIAQLERTLRNNPENLAALTTRNQSNRTAMTGALDQIAGTPAQMTAATTSRAATTAPMYQAASQAVVPADAQLGQLLARPSMQRAWDRAQQLASEEGISLVQPNANDVSGQTLQYLKMGLNDMRDTAEQRGMGAHEQRALDSTLASFNQWTTRNVPQLRAADQAYAAASAPINQMQIGGALRDRLVPALGDFGNNTRLSSNSYANALRNGDQLASQTTGIPTTLQQALSPSQMTTVNQVGEQLARRTNADELGRAVGSNTAQNLAGQNVLRQFLGPFGLPQGMGERAAQSTLGQSILRPLQWAAQVGEPRILQRLANASLNPQEAQRLLALAHSNPRLAQAIWARQGLLGAGAGGATQGLMATTN